MSLYTYNGGEYRSVAPSGVVSVRDWGATGDGTTDDTAAINDAIEYAASRGLRTVVVPDGTYMIRAHDPNWTAEQQQNFVFYSAAFVGGIRLRSGIHLALSDGATLKAIPNDAKWYRIVGIAGVSNVEVSGGTIQGERAAHIGANGGEWGHGISVVASSNVYIHDLTVKDCWGDGLNTNLHEMDDTNPCRRVRVARVVSDNNRRQGLSISSVVDMTVSDSAFTNTNGVAPEAGIDLESNGATSPTTDVTVTRCRLDGNNGSGFTMVDGFCDRVTFSDNRVNGNKCNGSYKGQVWIVVGSGRTYKIKDNWIGAPGAAGKFNVDIIGGTNVEISGNVMSGAPVSLSTISESRIAGNSIMAVPTTVPAVALASLGVNVTVSGNRISGGTIGVSMAGASNADRLAVVGNKISGATGAAVSVTAPTSNVLVKDNEAWSNGSGVVFDTVKTHTAHSIETARMDGTDTLPT